MSTDTVDIGTLIVSDPTFRGGRPCIAGTGVSVHVLAARYRYHGESVEQIAADRSDLPASHVHAAITYYLANQEQIDRELDQDEAESARLSNQSH